MNQKQPRSALLPSAGPVGLEHPLNADRCAAAVSLKQLQESNREITHDLNNLLLMVTSAVESARKHSDNPEILQKRLEQVSANLNRIRGLSHRLHCLNKEVPGCDSFDPVGISREVLEDIFSDEQVQVTVRSDEPAFRVRGDGREMERVFLNLFQNARDAMTGEGKLTVAFENRTLVRHHGVHPEKQLFISISDTGCGMSPENLARAFKDCFTTKPDGHGIGLSIVRKIIDALEGAIAIRSAPGRGTTFEITLPLAHRN